MIPQQQRRTFPTRVTATFALASIALLTTGTQRAHAQTYRVVPVVPTGASYATDISEDGKICGTKNTGLPGFVWMHDADGTNIVLETAKTPRAFSPSGNLIATDKGALFLFFGKIFEGSAVALASDLPASFRAYSINDDGVIVGSASSSTGTFGYFRNLRKPTTAWLGDGYYGAGNNTGSGSSFIAPFNQSTAFAINGQGQVGGYGVNATTYKDQPFSDVYTAGRPQPASGYVTLASQEKGAIRDLNESGLGGGYSIAFSDPSCQFPAFIKNGPSEFQFLGAGPAQFIYPNMKGCILGLNDNSEAVGWSNRVGDATKAQIPCLFTVTPSRQTRALNSLLEPRKVTTYFNGQVFTFYFPSLWTVTSAVDINNNGDIAATATYDSDPTPRAVLLKRL